MGGEVKKKIQCDLLFSPIGELATAFARDTPLHGKDMSSVVRIKDAALAIENEKIVACGARLDVLNQVELKKTGVQIDARNKLIIPGFVDPHTHLVFAGNRASEFLLRCQGASYQTIAQAGGGIVASMKATRQASLAELTEAGLQRLNKILESGTTTCEIKTGYGLSLESELNMMRAILSMANMQAVEIVPTFMPAHAFPPDLEKDKYVQLIKQDMLPALFSLLKDLKRDNLEKFPVYQDVFCDEGYFSLEDSKEILQEGLKYGFRPKIHSDEFANLGATSMAAEIGAVSADHLLNTSLKDIEKMAATDLVAVLLPGTSFFLNLKEHAQARLMIDKGVAIALGSDYNPGSCHIYSMLFIIGLACLHLKMTIDEAFTAATVNAAFALGKGKVLGQLKEGYQADFQLMDLNSLDEIPYNMVGNPIDSVYKKGKLVFAKKMY